MTILSPEFVENPENRCPVVLILDTSASMAGEPIEALNDGIATFKFEVEQDDLACMRVDLAVVTFGEGVSTLQHFTTIDEFMAPKLEAKGKTPLGKALEHGLELLGARKKEYRENGILYYRPWLFLITDGAPTDGDLWKVASRKIHEEEDSNKLSFFVVGVEGADFDTLKVISIKNRPPYQLKGLAFDQLFKWLSASVRRVSSGVVGGEMRALPPVSNWARDA